MKIKSVFALIFSMENLHGALEDASTGRRYKPEVLRYNCDAWEKLTELREEILSGGYYIERYFIFYVHEPKLRMIMSLQTPNCTMGYLSCYQSYVDSGVHQGFIWMYSRTW